ncbi:MAG: PTS sugar transporter subunit IIB [Treponema sp.]|jgi:PTS system cellobiose-specific IIB component|nr:PTS sugar transporter subunit IIB [Treponema sp.]
MDKLNVLLVCGGGASSGFVAANIRKEAKKQGLDMTVAARSETEIDSYIDEINCILLGPHLSYLFEDLKEQYKDRNIKIGVMEKSYYSTLDGAAAIKHIQSLFA